jgi:hypothetical protein
LYNSAVKNDLHSLKPYNLTVKRKRGKNATAGLVRMRR